MVDVVVVTSVERCSFLCEKKVIYSTPMFTPEGGLLLCSRFRNGGDYLDMPPFSPFIVI